MSDDLYSQPTLAPTRKVAATGVVGALTVLAIAGVNAWLPGIGDSYAMEIGAAVAALASFAAGYLFKERY